MNTYHEMIWTWKHNSFIYNSPKLEAINRSINREWLKSTVSYSHKGIRFSNHKGQCWYTHNYMDAPHRCGAENKSQRRKSTRGTVSFTRGSGGGKANVCWKNSEYCCLERERNWLSMPMGEQSGVNGKIWHDRRELHECTILSELYI